MLLAASPALFPFATRIILADWDAPARKIAISKANKKDRMEEREEKAERKKGRKKERKKGSPCSFSTRLNLLFDRSCRDSLYYGLLVIETRCSYDIPAIGGELECLG